MAPNLRVLDMMGSPAWRLCGDHLSLCQKPQFTVEHVKQGRCDQPVWTDILCVL